MMAPLRSPQGIGIGKGNMQKSIDTKSFKNMNDLLLNQKILDIIKIPLVSPLAELL